MCNHYCQRTIKAQEFDNWQRRRREGRKENRTEKIIIIIIKNIERTRERRGGIGKSP